MTHAMLSLIPSRRVCDRATRIIALLALVVLAAALASSLASCADKTAPRKAYITVEAATGIVNGVADAYEAHLITKDQLRALLPYADAVHKAQDDLDKAILAGTADRAAYLQALSDAVLELLNQEAAVKRLATPPATTTAPLR